MFKKATREKNRLRLALDGPSGSGKTYTALRLAHALAGPDGRIAVIDTEHGSASKYEGDAPDGIPWHWDECVLAHYAPSTYEAAIKFADKELYDVLVIDSLSHAWIGVGGALDQVDKKGGNKFTAWRDVTPQHDAMIAAILNSECHVIVTLRSKMEYVMEENEKGKMVPTKIGLRPIQREGVEYEFDVIGDLDLNHTLTISKSRCSAIDGKKVNQPGAPLMDAIKTWLFSGTEASKERAVVTIDDVEPVDPAIVKHIMDRVKQLEWTPEKLGIVLATQGVKKISELSAKSGLGLSTKLDELYLTKESNEAFS
jgi:hypothetical protein